MTAICQQLGEPVPSACSPLRRSLDMQASRERYLKEFPPLFKAEPQQLNHPFKVIKRSRLQQVSGTAASRPPALPRKLERHVQPMRVPPPATTPVKFEDVKRPMVRRINELECRLAVKEPTRRVRDVEATGSCFFLAGNLGRQDLELAAQTSNDAELQEAADSDRLAVVALMLQQRDMPLSDGDTLEQKLKLAALEPFAGERTCSCTRDMHPMRIHT